MDAIQIQDNPKSVTIHFKNRLMICNFTIPTMAVSQVSKNEVGAVGDVKLPLEPHTHRDWPLYAT